MRKGTWSTTAALIVLLSGAGVVLGGPRVLAADGKVTMVDADSDALKWRFEPAELTVAAGTTVVFKNDGSQPHTATADEGAFDSATMSPGKEFQYKFATPGDFKYHCEPHQWMKGLIRVTGTAATTAPTTATTVPAATGTTATTAPAGQASSTTTTAKAAAGASSTTTTTAAPAGATATTLAPATTPTSAPDTAGVTTTTEAPKGEAAAGGGHSSDSGGGESSPIGIAFAAISTLLLGAVSVKLLMSKA